MNKNIEINAMDEMVKNSKIINKMFEKNKKQKGKRN